MAECTACYGLGWIDNINDTGERCMHCNGKGTIETAEEREIAALKQRIAQLEQQVRDATTRVARDAVEIARKEQGNG